MTLIATLKAQNKDLVCSNCKHEATEHEDADYEVGLFGGCLVLTQERPYEAFDETCECNMTPRDIAWHYYQLGNPTAIDFGLYEEDIPTEEN